MCIQQESNSDFPWGFLNFAVPTLSSRISFWKAFPGKRAVVSHGLRNVFESTTAPRQEVVPFFTGLDRILNETLMFLAEKAEIGRKIGCEFLTGRVFWDEFGERVRRLQLGDDLDEVRKLFFLECCDVVRFLCKEHDLENSRHADLIALFMFNSLHRTGSIEIMARLRTAKPRHPSRYN